MREALLRAFVKKGGMYHTELEHFFTSHNILWR
jgi:hypothetical protein